jgi:hypothetical protein
MVLGDRQHPETRLRDAGSRLCSRPKPPGVARGWEEDTRVPLGVHTMLHHDWPGTVLRLSRYQERPCVRSTGA